MKLIEVLKEQENNIKDLIKKILIFSLPDGDENVAIQLVPSLLNQMDKNSFVLDLHVELFIEKEKIRKDVFEQILRGTIDTLQRRGRIPNFGTVKLRIKDVNIYKDKVKVELFKYIPPQIRDFIKRPRRIQDILFGQDNARMEDGVLPSIDSEYSLTHTQREERAKNLYKFFRKGKINGVSYLLDDYRKLTITPNYEKFDVKQNVITPHFDIVILADEPEVEEGHHATEVMNGIEQKFDQMGISIKF
jgi:hypothetical protein